MPKMTQRQLDSRLLQRSKRGACGSCRFAVEDVFDLDTDDQEWRNIPGFPGYQLSNKGYIRSFKSRCKYPFGAIMAGSYRKTTKDYIFDLTNKNNTSVRLSFDTIVNMVKNSPDKEVYRTCDVPFGPARNTRAFIDYSIDPIYGVELGEINRLPTNTIKDEVASLYHFKILQEEKENENKIIKPFRVIGEEIFRYDRQ